MTAMLSMRKVSKAYPGVQALEEVDFSAYSGEVMALIGENGAGKSTLLKILAGAESADLGTLLLAGAQSQVADPADAKRQGIAVIYQELNLASHLSVAENLFIGNEPRTRFGTIDWKEMRRGASAILDRLNIHVDPRETVGNLNIALRQMLEIARALLADARVVVMDEPTSSLTEEETRVLFEVIAELKGHGVAVIYVSHRMQEIFEVADRVTVLRDGKFVGSWHISETSSEQLVSSMVGRDLEDLYGTRQVPVDRSVVPALEVRNLSDGEKVSNVSFAVWPGEIVVFSGLIGSGRSEIVHAIFGASPPASGQILLEGRPLNAKATDEAIRAGVCLVPEDRKDQGIFPQLTVRENMSSASLESISQNALISSKNDRAMFDRFSALLKLRPTAREVQIRTLSGGNQQKVIIGRWLATDPKVLMLDEPTRGVDIGAKAEIYTLIRGIAERGVAVLMISSELPEVLGLADRILVMRAGTLAGELPATEATEESVMTLCT